MKKQAVTLIIILLIGCNDDKDSSTTYNVRRENEGPPIIQEVFSSETRLPITKTPVDILFFVNNNTSMRNTLGRFNTNIPQAFETFIDNLLELGLNFKIGILLSDDPNNKDTDGTLTSTVAAPDKAAFKTQFLKKIEYTATSTKESQEFLYTKQFFEENPDWSREGAYLIVIFATTHEGSRNRDIDLVTYLRDIKRDGELVKICAIVGNAPHIRRAAEETEGWGHNEIILTDPVHLNTLLSDLDGFLDVAEKRLKFKQHWGIEAPEDITVQVNNTNIPSSDWTFESGNNFITFTNKTHQALNPNANVALVLTKPVSRFILKKKLNVSYLDTTEIRIDRGPPIPESHWEYNREDNFIEFLPDHIPTAGSSINITYRSSDEN